MRRRNVASSANRLVAVAIVFVAMVFVVLVSNAFYNTNTPSARSTLPASDTILTLDRATLLEVDTDNDGLADWEEVLWNTDPNNGDTDGDGVLDGAEREEGRDPTVLGSGVLASAVSAFGEEGGPETERAPLTLTETVSQELFGSYMQAFGDKQNISSREQARMVDAALTHVSDYIEIPSYTRSDVTVVPNSTTAHATYINGVRVALALIEQGTPGEYNALALIAQGDTEIGITDLRTKTTAYATYTKSIASLPVPEEAADFHVMLVQALQGYTITLQNISDIQKDPMVGATGIASFTSAQGRLTNVLNVFLTYVEVFEQSIASPAVETAPETNAMNE